ncbi:MAG: hypothetical protein ABI377_07415 [Devosia sp.]
MPDEIVQVTEDAFRRLQQPQQDSPESDEDLANAAQVAIWNCDPDLHRRVRASANDGYLTLSGTVATERQRSSIETAVLGLGDGTNRLTNMIEVIGATQNEEEKPTPPAAHQEVAAEPMLYVRRYCGIEPYSLSAALHEALAVLDRRFLDLGLTTPDEAIVVYRNRLPESVVLDVGYVLPSSARAKSDDELKVGMTPGGSVLSAPAAFGSRGLFEVHDQLIERARLGRLSPMNFTWQRLPLEAVRLRVEHPAPLYLPIG